MKRDDLTKMDELEKLTDRELIKTAVKQWDHLTPIAKTLAVRLEDRVNQFQSLVVSTLRDNKERPDGNDTGRKG